LDDLPRVENWENDCDDCWCLAKCGELMLSLVDRISETWRFGKSPFWKWRFVAGKSAINGGLMGKSSINGGLLWFAMV
jgi:hypothetical protein